MRADWNTVVEPGTEARAASSPMMPTRPFYWSVRREVWENRSIYIAPLVSAGLALFGFFVSTFQLARHVRGMANLDPAKQQAEITMPYNGVAFLLLITAFVVGVFYSLDALYGERRDRSVLFWKSMPVSDWTTVLSKACVPMLVLPIVVFPIIVVLHWTMLLVSSAVLTMNGMSPAALWQYVKLGPLSLAMLYAFAAVSLWFSPIFAYLLLVSAWAPRAPFIWFLLPPFVVSVLERIAFGTTHFAAMVAYRFTGWYPQAFDVAPPGSAPPNPLAALTPGRFLETPGLWVGLGFAALFLAGAVRFRRYRGPI